MEKVHVKRTFKDSLFRMIFREKEELLSLYNAVNGCYTDAGELEIHTIEDAVYMRMKNDAAFLFEDYLNLYEAQSSWNPNMPLRGLFYFSSLYRGYVEQRQLDLYSKVRLKLPFPKFIVFYNGLKRTEERWEEHLSDSFREQGKNVSEEKTEPAEKAVPPSLECVAQMVNINYGHNRELMQNCRKLYEYSYFVEAVRMRLDKGLKLDAAVDAAVKECIEGGVLADFLRKHRAEVKDVILAEYNEELHIKSEKELSFEEGEAAGSVKAILTLLRMLGTVPEALKKQIEEESDPGVLERWLKAAAKASSLEEFQEKQ